MGNSFEQNMPSELKNEPFMELGRPTIGNTTCQNNCSQQ